MGLALFVLIRSRYVMRYVICFPCTHIYRLYTAHRQGPSQSENIIIWVCERVSAFPFPFPFPFPVASTRRAARRLSIPPRPTTIPNFGVSF